MKRILAIGCLVIAACSNSPTTSADEILPWLQGSWEYTATQTQPSLRMSGALNITEQNGRIISGSITYSEVDRSGYTRQRVNMFTGRIRNARNIEIDAYVPDGTRQHVGLLSGDSIGGNFAQTRGDETLNGSFAARRR